MAEVHIIGEVKSASGFDVPSLFCVWQLHYGGGWRLIAGSASGQTQTDAPRLDDTYALAHPIDVQLATSTLHGWPRLHVHLWSQDGYGRAAPLAYALCHVPTQPGAHVLRVNTWRPAGSLKEELTRALVGGGVRVASIDAVLNSALKINTVAMGSVRLELNVVTRHFDKFGIET